MNLPSDQPFPPALPAPKAPLILVIDDLPEIRLIVQRLGKQAGFRVVGCPHAEAAWDYLYQTTPDLILLDINLPGASGLDMCQRLRETPTMARLRVALFCQSE